MTTRRPNEGLPMGHQVKSAMKALRTQIFTVYSRMSFSRSVTRRNSVEEDVTATLERFPQILIHDTGPVAHVDSNWHSPTSYFNPILLKLPHSSPTPHYFILPKYQRPFFTICSQETDCLHSHACAKTNICFSSHLHPKACSIVFDTERSFSGL